MNDTILTQMMQIDIYFAMPTCVIPCSHGWYIIAMDDERMSWMMQY